MMPIPLEEGFFPERWQQAIYSMPEKIPGVPMINKLRINHLLEADLNQVLRSAFARNISKLAQETPGIIIEHQYGRSHQTCLTPVMKKLLTVHLQIKNKTNGIIFDNDAKGCNRSSNTMTNRLFQKLRADSRPPVGPIGTSCANRIQVSFTSYKSTMDKLLYGIGQRSCSSPIAWALLNHLLLTALHEEFDCI
jgi:hypothetical protein